MRPRLQSATHRRWATRLQTLGLVDADYEDHSECWLAALRVVATLPALRHLALGGCGTYLPRLIEPLLELQRRSPHLKVSCDFVIEDVSEGYEERQRMLSFFGLRMPWLEMDFQELIA